MKNKSKTEGHANERKFQETVVYHGKVTGENTEESDVNNLDGEHNQADGEQPINKDLHGKKQETDIVIVFHLGRHHQPKSYCRMPFANGRMLFHLKRVIPLTVIYCQQKFTYVRMEIQI